MSITVYGASDDLIEIEGDIREEFNPSDEEPSFLGFSDGTILKVIYDDEGIWRVSPIRHGTATYTIAQSTGDDDYSDRATLDGDIEWVVHGTQFAVK